MDARGFWDGIAQFFGYDTWNWGSAADWFAAVGTVGAVLLTLAFFWNERLRNRRAHVDNLVVWIEWSPSLFDNPVWCEVHVFNAGTLPIPVASIVFRTAGRNEGFRFKREPPDSVIFPGESFSESTQVLLDYREHGTVNVFMRDYRDEVWSKNMVTGKVKRRHSRWVKGKVLYI